MYWTTRVEWVVKRLEQELGESPFNFFESLYKHCITNHNTDAIFDAVGRMERYQKRMATYQNEILQIVGVTDEWRRADVVSKTILTSVNCLQELGMYKTLEGLDMETTHAAKEFLYQSLFA